MSSSQPTGRHCKVGSLDFYLPFEWTVMFFLRSWFALWSAFKEMVSCSGEMCCLDLSTQIWSLGLIIEVAHFPLHFPLQKSHPNVLLLLLFCKLNSGWLTLAPLCRSTVDVSLEAVPASACRSRKPHISKTAQRWTDRCLLPTAKPCKALAHGLDFVIWKSPTHCKWLSLCGAAQY